MDTAMIYCEGNNLPITTELRRHLSNAAEARQGGQFSRAQREGVKHQALRIMANLIITGATLREAAGKAAVWTSSTPHPQKASSLQKQYSATWRKPTVSVDAGFTTDEAELRESRLKNADEEVETAWRKHLAEMPLPNDDEWGERR